MVSYTTMPLSDPMGLLSEPSPTLRNVGVPYTGKRFFPHVTVAGHFKAAAAALTSCHACAYAADFAFASAADFILASRFARPVPLSGFVPHFPWVAIQR